MVSGSHIGQVPFIPPGLGKQFPAPSNESYGSDDRENRIMCSMFPFSSRLSDTTAVHASNKYLWSNYYMPSIVPGACTQRMRQTHLHSSGKDMINRYTSIRSF